MLTPSITEDDLLAFQISHFGDDSKPAEWFVDAQTALASATSGDDGRQDDLGHYADGKMRMLTDEQIALFRHSEIELLLRERRLRRDEEDYHARDVGTVEGGDEEEDRDHENFTTHSDSSLEDDLVGLAQPPTQPPPRPTPPTSTSRQKPKHRKSAAAKKRAKRRQSQTNPSDDSASTGSMQRHRAQEVPYDQRNKRRWEDYIEDTDPVHGSITHRRMVRELDQHLAEAVEVDYGDE
ncbi:hypothetical protein LTR78_010284 [Recurvomyces mirabilis]|uniref:Uncharacterized protein n=1 Tax=Recurvomyces mirabilis TaxID=574656 RepID=A0AAE0TSC9_9PEZI|nr:hypothetical protein LTR78_010284 [Recurvomyces mirabilis]KAK5149646.1 hypothetical protein LTS14_010777 [Recurvomyces mirabilis]